LSKKESEFKPLTDRLDALIRLVALTLPKDINQAKKIEILSGVGLSPAEIAGILGTTPNTVSVTLYDIRKKKSTSTQTGTSRPEESAQTLISEQSDGEAGQKPQG
jgi:DNA-directed RNA polymerase specialized sigma24 family protein